MGHKAEDFKVNFSCTFGFTLQTEPRTELPLFKNAYLILPRQTETISYPFRSAELPPNVVPKLPPNRESVAPELARCDPLGVADGGSHRQPETGPDCATKGRGEPVLEPYAG